MAAAFEEHAGDAKLAADLKKKAKPLRETNTDRPKDGRAAGFAYTHACGKGRKGEKRIAGYQGVMVKTRARLAD